MRARAKAVTASATAPPAKASAVAPMSGRSASHGGIGAGTPATPLLRVATSVALITWPMNAEPSLDHASAQAMASAANSAACSQARRRTPKSRQPRAASSAMAG